MLEISREPTGLCPECPRAPQGPLWNAGSQGCLAPSPQWQPLPEVLWSSPGEPASSSRASASGSHYLLPSGTNTADSFVKSFLVAKYGTMCSKGNINYSMQNILTG